MKKTLQNEQCLFYGLSSGLELLRKQRLERSKRLDGLNLAKYFQDMEKLRNGLEPSNHTKKYMLVRYN